MQKKSVSYRIVGNAAIRFSRQAVAVVASFFAPVAVGSDRNHKSNLLVKTLLLFLFAGEYHVPDMYNIYVEAFYYLSCLSFVRRIPRTSPPPP